MLTVFRALEDQGLEHWRVVAKVWGIVLPEGARDPLAELISGMLSPERVAEVYASFAEPAQASIETMRAAGGRMPAVLFFQRFGEIRTMGAARRQREEPWRNPTSIAEELWYAGWIGRTFLRASGTAQEYVFLPEDLEALLPARGGNAAPGWKLLAYQPDRSEVISRAGFQAADDAAMLLAYLRNWPQPASRAIEDWRPRAPLRVHARQAAAIPLLASLLREIGSVGGDPLQPDVDRAREFLEKSRPEANAFLLAAWRDSRAWNDLREMGSLRMEGDWPNDAPAARIRFLDTLREAPQGEWCTIQSAVESLESINPEFLRPASAFNAWDLRDGAGDFVDSAHSWTSVEGRLAGYYLTGPMTWLGAAETAPAEAARAFRLTGEAQALWQDSQTETAQSAARKARIRPDGTILLPESTPILLRYQLARCAEWISRSGAVFIYRLTPASLERAKGQGVHAAHVLALLEKLLDQTPPPLAKAVSRWEKSGKAVSFSKAQILIPGDEQTGARLGPRLEALHGAARRIQSPVWLISPTAMTELRKLLLSEGILLDEPEDCE